MKVARDWLIPSPPRACRFSSHSFTRTMDFGAICEHLENFISGDYDPLEPYDLLQSQWLSYSDDLVSGASFIDDTSYFQSNIELPTVAEKPEIQQIHKLCLENATEMVDENVRNCFLESSKKLKTELPSSESAALHVIPSGKHVLGLWFFDDLFITDVEQRSYLVDILNLISGETIDSSSLPNDIGTRYYMELLRDRTRSVKPLFHLLHTYFVSADFCEFVDFSTKNNAPWVAVGTSVITFLAFAIRLEDNDAVKQFVLDNADVAFVALCIFRSFILHVSDQTFLAAHELYEAFVSDRNPVWEIPQNRSVYLDRTNMLGKGHFEYFIIFTTYRMQLKRRWGHFSSIRQSSSSLFACDKYETSFGVNVRMTVVTSPSEPCFEPQSMLSASSSSLHCASSNASPRSVSSSSPEDVPLHPLPANDIVFDYKGYTVPKTMKELMGRLKIQEDEAKRSGVKRSFAPCPLAHLNYKRTKTHHDVTVSS